MQLQGLCTAAAKLALTQALTRYKYLLLVGYVKRAGCFDVTPEYRKKNDTKIRE